MGKALYAFRCLYDNCGHEFEAMAERGQASSTRPTCPNCGGDNTSRIWTFGQFTFKGGLPSNHGRDGVWR